MFARLRLLPVTIGAALLLLAVKVGDVWQDADALFGPALAEVTEAEESTGNTGEAAGSNDPPSAIGAPQSSVDADPDGPSGGAVNGSAQSTFDVIDITPEDFELLESLAARREQLEARDREIDLREKLLIAAEERVDAKVEELKKLQETVEILIVRLDEQQDTKIKSLVKIYEQMRPKDAARIFDQLDMDVLLRVIDRMREAKAAAIMGKMDSEKAKSMTILLAERRELAEPGTNSN